MNNFEKQDTNVRIAVYGITISRGAPPAVFELAEELDLTREKVHLSLERLATAKALVLQPGNREVLMAGPFSAVPTPFAVSVGDQLYYGNCIWDALGIPAMLKRDARIECSCGCCGEAMRLEVSAGSLEPFEGIVHFAVPAHRWWQDIVFS